MKVSPSAISRSMCGVGINPRLGLRAWTSPYPKSSAKINTTFGRGSRAAAITLWPVAATIHTRHQTQRRKVVFLFFIRRIITYRKTVRSGVGTRGRFEIEPSGEIFQEVVDGESQAATLSSLMPSMNSIP